MQSEKRRTYFLPIALLYGSLALNYVACLHLFLYSGKAAEWLHFSMSNRRTVLLLLAYVPMLILIAGAIVMVRHFWQAEYKRAKGVDKGLFVCWAVVAVLLPVACCPMVEIAFSWVGVAVAGGVYMALVGILMIKLNK